MRRAALLMLSCLVLTAATATAGLGINLFGKAIHSNEYNRDNLNEENWGLGLRHDLRVGEASALFVEGGSFLDSKDKWGWHAGVAYRHRIWGPFSGGAGLYLFDVSTINGDYAVVAPLPQLSLSTGALEWNATIVPPVNGTKYFDTVMFSATVYPMGRTKAGKGMGPRHPDSRSGLQVSVLSDFTVGEYQGYGIMYRQFRRGGDGFRVGLDGYFNSRSVQFESGGEDDRLGGHITVICDRLSTISNGRDFDLVLATGLGFWSRVSYLERRNDYYGVHHESSLDWSAGGRVGLSVEYALGASVLLTAECLTSLYYEYEDDYSNKYTSWSLNLGQAGLGAVLYFD